MATGSKNGQTKKKPAGRKKPAAKKYNNKLITEAVLLIFMALCVIFFLANFGVGGIVGKGISAFFFGLFGILAYIFPILLFAAVIFAMSNKNSSIARVKLIAVLFELIFLCTLIQLISGSHSGEWNVGDFYINSSTHKNGGGFFGGMLCLLFSKLFGNAGAYIFTVVLIIIAAVIITEHSFIGGVKKNSKKVYNAAKRDMEAYKADVAVKRKEKERMEELRASEKMPPKKKRSSVKVEGITTDTCMEKADAETTGEDVYSYEKAEDIKPFDENEYANVVDATDYAMRHFQDEQSIPFEPAYEDVKEILPPSGTVETAAANTAIVNEEPQRAEEDYIDMELVKNELEKEQLLKPDKEKNVKPEPVHGNVTEQAQALPVKTSHTAKNNKYKLPPVSLLKRSSGTSKGNDGKDELRATAGKLQQTLATFGVNVTITDVSRGPAVTRYELQPEQGVKVSKIVSLADDIKLNLAAADIRIEAPIPGKAAVGIEVPNKENSGVMLGDLIASKEFRDAKSKIAFAAGKDIAGQIVMADIAKMPHLLIAGATGSGKSVCINTIIMSILFKARPEEVKLIMVDPKVVELSVYNGIPHLLTPVVTDPKKAAAALNWAVAEMMKRYQLFATYGVRDMKGFNEKISGMEPEEGKELPEVMAQIVIIIDELADLMMVASGDVEDAIVRLAQLARAAGIHLIIATQRPSVNVITGLIKANVPSRIAFSVSSGVDSRTILDMVGAEKLLGKGDMLFYPQGYQKPARVQGAFVSDEEVSAVVDFIKENSNETGYSEEIENHLSNPEFEESQAFSGDRDQYFADAGRFIIEKERASIGMLQRVFKIGFNRAARIMDQLGEAGVVGPEEGTKPRKVMMTMEEFEEYLKNN